MLADRAPRARLLGEAARRARHLGRPVLASWTEPASLTDPLSFFGQAEPGADRTLWLRPATGEASAGIGTAHVISGHGVQRFDQVAAGWRELLTAAVLDSAVGAPPGGPRLLGASSFDPNRVPTARWAGFGDARFVLPARQLEVREGVAWLTTNQLIDAAGERVQPAPRTAPRSRTLSSDAALLSPATWQALVERTVAELRAPGAELTKVVLARAVEIRRDTPFDPRPVLRQLAARYRECTVFAVGQGDACFLGATPERLIALHDGVVSTMALAGSVARGVTPAADQRLGQQLLRDPKERAEHAVVVAALREALSADGLCTRIVADAQPRVQQLPNLQHLLTPVRAQLAPDRTIFDLVARLHPTPAVGGQPREAALALIRAREELDRGWYAGPLGWVDASGAGEFVVGIRSALVRGPLATLYAGCGIVAGSEPAAELAESGWKLRPMLAALGIEDEP
jgi:isochorismate synthase